MILDYPNKEKLFIDMVQIILHIIEIISMMRIIKKMKGV
jgi:hypothetical protein